MITVDVLANIVSVVIPIVLFGWKIASKMNETNNTLIEIRTLLASTIHRIEHIEKQIDKLDARVSSVEKTINWDK
jgi:hypothetical protein